ncbi:MAG TPA: tRNA1(Val) (adenine(37)-N6)-methyltransferase [Syntrophales bacterium]|nr:tRNA1(Val) (adenine(37)-N6)-methyltransferase [Syntrophales bacterium]
MTVYDDETLDELLKGKLKIIQKKKGYRFSVDSILLAHFVRLEKGDKVIDLGTGSGVLAIILASRFEESSITGLEIQEELSDMARRSAVVNSLDDRVGIVEGDARRAADIFGERSFDAAVLNPPYRKPGAGRISVNRQKAVARHEIMGGLSCFLEASSRLLRSGGRVFAIYTASRLPELIVSMRKHGIEPKRMRMVHSETGSGGEFILMEGMKGAGEELSILPPLFLYGRDGGYTDEARLIFDEICSPSSVS